MPIQLQENVALRTCDDALRPQYRPPAVRSIAHLEGGPIQPDRGDVGHLRASVDEHPGALESAAVARETSSDDRRTARSRGQPLGKSAAVDVDAIAEDEHGSEVAAALPQTLADHVPHVGRTGLAHGLNL